MRKDENGNECPATLGEYRDLCAAIGGEESEAVKLLDGKIAKYGRDDAIIVPDSQMRLLLMPLLLSDPNLKSKIVEGLMIEAAFGNLNKKS
jgi:hypothetical protein